MLIKIEFNKAQNMIENRNQNIDLSKFRPENNVEMCLPILYMCMSKYFKKEDYEKINERGNVIQKLYSERGKYWFKISYEGRKNWSAGWSNEAKTSILNLFKFLWVLSGARPRCPREFLDSTWPCLSLPGSRFFQSSWDPISLYV